MTTNFKDIWDSEPFEDCPSSREMIRKRLELTVKRFQLAIDIVKDKQAKSQAAFETELRKILN